MEQNETPTTEARAAARQGLTDKAIDLRKLLGMCRKYWYWFVISVIICCSLGYILYKRSTPVYSREAQVMVVRADNGSNSEIASSFSTMGLFQQTPESWTQMVTLTTPSVMLNVAERLKLNVAYTVEGQWHPEKLYGSTQPLVVEFPGLDTHGYATLETTIEPGGKIRLGQLRTNTEKGGSKVIDIDKTVNYVGGVELQTRAGLIKITPNPLYTGGPITEPVNMTVTHSSLYDTAVGLSGRVVASLHPQSDQIIVLTLSDSNPQLATDILSTIISAYNENSLKERAEIAEATSRFINDRLNVIEQELGSVESNISSFKSAHMLPDVDAASSMYMEQTNSASNALGDMTTRLTMTRYIRDFMASASNSNTVLPANTGVQDVNIEGQIADYNRTLMERNSLAANSSPSNPLVVDLDKRLEGLRRALIQSLDNTIASLNTSISSLQQRRSESAGKVATAPGQARYLLSVERQQKVKESLYLFLLQKREENELSQSFVPNRIRVISEPVGSPSPVAPVRDKILMIAFMIGLLLPLAVLFVIETLDNKVRDKRDFSPLGVPFMGEIPKNSVPYGLRKRKTSVARQGIVVEKDNLDMINEAFRVLRTNLEIVARRDGFSGATVIAVTSANPGSGKTFVSMNLASALAIKGHRVLMIDMDLRRATLSTILGSGSKSAGLVNFLVNPSAYDNNISNLIVRDLNDQPSLDLLPSGTVPPNPAELLADPALSALLADLREQYDYIFLDCPPVEIVADAQIINSQADMTLFIVRAGLFRRSDLPTLEQMYDTKRYRNMSVVLNGVSDMGDGYGKYQYYKKGYRYSK